MYKKNEALVRKADFNVDPNIKQKLVPAVGHPGCADLVMHVFHMF